MAVQDEPFHSFAFLLLPGVAASTPPILNPADDEVPRPRLLYTVVGKSLTSAHDVPFQDSVKLTPKGGPPPKAKPEVKIPKLPKFLLAVFPSLTSAQTVPLYVSVLFVCVG